MRGMKASLVLLSSALAVASQYHYSACGILRQELLCFSSGLREGGASFVIVSNELIAESMPDAFGCNNGDWREVFRRIWHRPDVVLNYPDAIAIPVSLWIGGRHPIQRAVFNPTLKATGIANLSQHDFKIAGVKIETVRKEVNLLLWNRLFVRLNRPIQLIWLHEAGHFLRDIACFKRYKDNRKELHVAPPRTQRLFYRALVKRPNGFPRMRSFNRGLR